MGDVEDAIGAYLESRRRERGATFAEAADKYNERRRRNQAEWEASLQRPETAPDESSDDG